MRTPSYRPPRRGTERMLIVRVALALGLALLLVIGAWSTSHRSADAHTGVCLAPGVSTSSVAHGPDSADATTGSPREASPIDAGLVVIAALCCFLLVLLLRRLTGAPLLHTGTPRCSIAPALAGPRRVVPALSLAQLSVSRT